MPYFCHFCNRQLSPLQNWWCKYCNASSTQARTSCDCPACTRTRLEISKLTSSSSKGGSPTLVGSTTPDRKSDGGTPNCVQENAPWRPGMASEGRTTGGSGSITTRSTKPCNCPEEAFETSRSEEEKSALRCSACYWATRSASTTSLDERRLLNSYGLFPPGMK